MVEGAPSLEGCCPKPSRASIHTSSGVKWGVWLAFSQWILGCWACCQALWVSGLACLGLPSQCTQTSKPCSASRCAATRPSPPLLPGPQRIHACCAWGAMARANRAMLRPARCIRLYPRVLDNAMCSMALLLVAFHSGCGCLLWIGMRCSMKILKTLGRKCLYIHCWCCVSQHVSQCAGASIGQAGTMAAMCKIEPDAFVCCGTQGW